MTEKNTNSLDTSKRMLPFIIIGALALVFLTGFILTVSQKNSPAPQINSNNLPAYPTSQPQIFNNTSSDQFGALVVTSKLDGVKVTIDEKEVQAPNFFPYSNTPPFTVPKIPSGNHILRATKENYLTAVLNVVIKDNQITSQDISLFPNPDLVSLRKAESKMPVVTDQYNIEYLNYIGIIQVNISAEPFEQNKQKAIQWFKEQGVTNPEAVGVQFNDLTKTYVH